MPDGGGDDRMSDGERVSYRLGDAHDGVHCQAVHLLPFDVLSEELQHGRLRPQVGHLLHHLLPDTCGRHTPG